MIKAAGLKTSCTNSIPIFCQMPAMLQTGGGDEITFEFSADSLKNQLFISNDQLTNVSMDFLDLNDMISPRQEDEPLLDLSFKGKNKDKLILSSEVEVKATTSGLEDKSYLSEEYISLTIEQHLKQLEKRKLIENTKSRKKLEYYLKRLIGICLSSDLRNLQTFEDNYLDHLKLEMAMLRNWIEVKIEEMSFLIEATNLDRNQDEETRISEYFNFPNVLKRMCAILMIIKKNTSLIEFEMPWHFEEIIGSKTYFQCQEYSIKENSDDDYLGCTFVKEIQSSCNDKTD